MSYREYIDHFVVQQDAELIETALAKAAIRGVLEIGVLSDEGSTAYRVLDPQPQYWANDELSSVKGTSEQGDQVTINFEPHQLPTLIVWADNR